MVNRGYRANSVVSRHVDDYVETFESRVLEDIGRVASADGQYLVVSESGSEYLVDARLMSCECPDHRFRDRECKHIKRCAYATGARPVPPIVDQDDVAGELGEHCSGEPRWA